MKKITDDEILELTEKIMITHKYIQIKKELIEKLSQLKFMINMYKHNNNKKVQEIEKFCLDVQRGLLNDDKIPQPLFLEIKKLTLEIENIISFVFKN